MVNLIVLAAALSQVPIENVGAKPDAADAAKVVDVAQASLVLGLPEDCLFVSINGQLMQAKDQLRAPASPQADTPVAAFWAACFPAKDAKTPSSWHRMNVSRAVDSEVLKHNIELDLAGPELHLEWTAPAPVKLSDAKLLPEVIGPKFALKVIGNDQSGMQQASLLVNDVTRAADQWQSGLADDTQRVHLTLEGKDIVGNVTRTELGNIAFDAIAPTLSFRTLNTPDGAPNGSVGKPPYTLELAGTDANGPVQLSLNGCAGNARMRCVVDRAESILIGIDALGNRAQQTIVLQEDATGPAFSVDGQAAPPQVRMKVGDLVRSVDGQAAPPQVRMKVGDLVRIDANDPAGVAKGCARFGSSCQKLPMRYRAVSSGRYRLFLKATDAFGNARQQVLNVEVSR